MAVSWLGDIAVRVFVVIIMTLMIVVIMLVVVVAVVVLVPEVAALMVQCPRRSQSPRMRGRNCLMT